MSPTDQDLAAGERTLIGAGKAESVRASREAYQDLIRHVFAAIVERATGRRVVGFTSSNVVAAAVPWVVEVFRLAEPAISRRDPR